MRESQSLGLETGEIAAVMGPTRRRRVSLRRSSLHGRVDEDSPERTATTSGVPRFSSAEPHPAAFREPRRTLQQLATLIGAELKGQI